MSTTAFDKASGALLAVLLAFGAYVMVADFTNIRRAQGVEAPMPLEELTLPQSWGGYAARRLARAAGDAPAIAPEAAEATLQAAAVRYPLDAVQWLDLARMSARDGDAERVAALLARANAVQPFERRSLWAAAQVALQTGNAQLAETQLRQWLQLYPRDTGQALFIGSRWIDTPGELLDRMLPDGRQYLVQAMEIARRRTDTALAEAVWQRLHPAPALDEPLFLNFVELLLAKGQIDRAIELWAEQDETFSPGGLANGDFSRPLGEPLGLNWRIGRVPPGMQIDRDMKEHLVPPASLRVEFNGKENIRSGAPWIRIPVQPGRHYRVSGAWRAEGLTTRSLPYLQVASEQGNLRETLELPDTQFGWQTWAIEFQVPEEDRMVRLQLRRDRTNAFDRNIDGILWLDDISIQESIPPKTLQTIASEALGNG